MTRFGAVALAFVVALVCVAASAGVQRVGGQAVYNDECRLGLGEAACLEDQEVVGLPVAFLVDSPGVSVVHQVSIGEDRFYAWLFALDVVIVWAALAGAWVLVRRRRGAAGVALLSAFLVSGCRSVPHVVDEGGGHVRVDAYIPDPDTGRLVRGALERGDVTVAFDSVAVRDGLLTVSGTAEIEGRGGYGFARLVRGYDRTGIPEATPPPERPGPYPWAGRPLAEWALAYGATLWRSGRFVLRAPVEEARTDTILVAYGEVADWVRAPVAELLAGRRFWASAPGAVPNPEARGRDGLTLRAAERTVEPGDSVRFVLAFQPPLSELPPAPRADRFSPEFGSTCLWQLERWDESWDVAPRSWWWTEGGRPVGDEACTLEATMFTEPGERRDAMMLAPEVPSGRYRWCLDTTVVRNDRLFKEPVCSTAFVVER